MKRTILAVTCALSGCLAQAGPGPVAPSSSPPVSVPAPGPSAAAPTPGALPTPFLSAPPSQSDFAVSVTPEVPCPGQQVTIEGHRFRGITGVNAWLGSPTASVATTPPDMFAPRGAVMVGSAQPDAEGTFRITFTLQAHMGPVSTGGELVLRPGQQLNLSFIGNGRPTPGDTSFQVGSLSCAGFSPPPFEAHLEPAAPCAGATAHVVGNGFTGPTARLEFAMPVTRLGDGPRLTREVPIGPDGKLDFAFDPAELKDGAPAFFRADSYYQVEAFDPATNRSVRLPFPYCNPTLGETLAAVPGIEPTAGIQGHLAGPTTPNDQPYEALVLRSQADMDAWTARHGLTAEVVAKLPPIDFASAEAIVVSEGALAHTSEALEIAAVARADGGYRVYPIRWEYYVPVLWDFNFDLVVVPRQDGPVDFRPVADARAGDRPETLHRRARLDFSPRTPPTVTP